MLIVETIARIGREHFIKGPAPQGAKFAGDTGSRLNELDRRELSRMPKGTLTPTGPMRTQPRGRVSILPTQALPCQRWEM